VESDPSVAFYFKALRYVLDSGFQTEIEWYRTRTLDNVSETSFLREYTWVVLCSGFRESVVRKHFSYISLAFYDFESAELIAAEKQACVDIASLKFGNLRKLLAVATVAEKIRQDTFPRFWSELSVEPVVRLKQLPFIGSATSWHLAKNLGMSVAKPDRHLVDLAKLMGFSTTHELCMHVSHRTVESQSVVDTVLWRAAALAGSSRALMQRLAN
jgi:hypothetical protein